MYKNWIVVGVSGVTCGGKTTLVEAIKKRYPESEVIHQDEYFFFQEDDPRHIKVPSLNCVNWELLSSLDMIKLRSDVENILKRTVTGRKKLLIIEGFLVLNDTFLSTICDKKLFFTLPIDECRRRRSERPPTVGFLPDLPGYFEIVLWPEYLKSKEEATKLNPDIQFVDGLKDTDIILNAFLEQLKQFQIL